MSPAPELHRATAAELDQFRLLLVDAGLPTIGLDTAWNAWVATEASGDVIGGVAIERHGDGVDVAYLLRSLVVRAGSRHHGLGESLVRTALVATIVDSGGAGAVALLTETADTYFPRFGFRPLDRADLPASLHDSEELRGACLDSARAMLRPPSAVLSRLESRR